MLTVAEAITVLIWFESFVEHYIYQYEIHVFFFSKPKNCENGEFYMFCGTDTVKVLMTIFFYFTGMLQI